MEAFNSCRICLTDGQKNQDHNTSTSRQIMLKNLFTETIFDGLFLTPASLLNEYFNAQIVNNDGFPQYICDYCLNQLRIVHTFKNALENSKLVLLQYAQDCHVSLDALKSENDSDDDFPDSIDDPAQCVQVKTESTKREDEDDDQPLSKIVKKKSGKKRKKSVIRNILTKKPSTESQSSNSQWFFCLICEAKFVEEAQLYEHCCRKHKVTKKVGRSCDYCNDKLEDFRALLVHRKRHLTPYLCEYCWAGYFTQEELDYHYKNCKKLNGQGDDKDKDDSQELSGEKNSCQCHICGKAYSTTYIHCHMLIHGDSKYRCEECGKTFKQPRSLQSHIQYIHRKERSIKCNMCEAIFLTTGARSAHTRQMHQQEKKFACELCEKRFFNSYTLNRHMITHDVIRNYSCSYCEKSYYTQQGLEEHLKSHNIEEDVMRYGLV